VVVTVGDATGLAIVVLLRPVVGAHEYVVPPDPFSVVDVPAQITMLEPAFATGIG